MGYLAEPRTTTTFVTACKAIEDGRERNISLEIRPEFAILKLDGIPKRYPLAWERIFELARQLDISNERLESRRQPPSKSLKTSGRHR